MISNPFQFGSVVKETQFCSRSRLEQRLASYMRSGQNAVLFGVRRVGKSSLIHRSAAKIRGSRLIYADFWGVRTPEDFVRRCVQSLESLQDSASIFEKITKALPGISISMTIDPLTGAPSLSPVFQAKKQNTPETVAQVAKLWKSLDSGKEKIIVALDEFQDLAAIEHGEQVLGILRREIQMLSGISFVFCGSIRNEMWKIFNEDGGAFYKSTSALEVTEDDFDDWDSFLTDRFSAGKLRIAPEVLDQIIQYAGGNPGDTQQLCASVWNAARERNGRVANIEDVRRALRDIFADEKKGYEQIVSDISAQQTAVLRAIAQIGGESVQSTEFLSAAGITHASSAKKAANRLVKRRILQETPEGLRFSNPFFRLWLLHVDF